jgi:hypothetical protein
MGSARGSWVPWVPGGAGFEGFGDMGRLLIATTMVVTAGLIGQVPAQSPERDEAAEWFWRVRDQAHEAIMPLNVPDLLVAYRG